MRRARRKVKSNKKLTKRQQLAIAILKKKVSSSDIFVTLTGEELLAAGYVKLVGKPIKTNRLYRVRQVEGLPRSADLLPITVPPELKESSKLIKALIKQEKERIRQTYLTTRTGKSV